MTDISGDDTTQTYSQWRPLLVGILWAAIVGGALVAMSIFGFKPEGPDAWTYDWRTFMFSKQAKAPRKDIAVVMIGEQTLAD